MRFNPYEADTTAYGHLYGLARHLGTTPLDQGLRALVEIRASQINGCAFCLAMHIATARRLDVTEAKLDQLAGWRESPEFSASERAALDLTEKMVRVGDGGRVDDATWDAVRGLFSDDALAALIYTVVLIQAWNVLNVAVEMPPHAHLPRLTS